jgi:hypothetical protein
LLIKIQFEFIHFPISQKKIDLFNTSVQQVQIIQPGENRPLTAFKHKDMVDGPIQIKESSPDDEPAITVSNKHL